MEPSRCSTGPRRAGADEGLASHATRLAAQWLARKPSVHCVEARIGQGEGASKRVALNAGFTLTETIPRSDTVSGDTDELRYVMDKPSTTESS
jgi:RimJ/RimL family protein N-acetyltransferase